MLAAKKSVNKWFCFVMRSFHAYLDSLVWVRGNLDTSGYLAFLRAANLGVDGEEALQSVFQRITAAGGRPRPGKLEHQLQCAQIYVQTHEPASCRNGLANGSRYRLPS
jgi:hypothetical protein